MEAFRQDVHQEAADELVCRKCHELVPLGTFDPVVLVFERDAHRVIRERAAIGDGDAMRVAREVRENGFGSAERLLRIDHPFRSPDRDEEGGERFGISERCVRAEELESADLVGRDQHLQDPPVTRTSCRAAEAKDARGGAFAALPVELLGVFGRLKALPIIVV